eukprot:jgi/Orpsp1_1/1186314/evm.model.d7180000049696.1
MSNNNNNNNVSDGPIPFFSANDNQSNFLSGTNIADSTAQTQTTQPIQQQNSTTTGANKQSVQDVSSLFGNNKEDSFLSSINSAGNTTNNNTQIPSTLQNSHNLYYSQ